MGHHPHWIITKEILIKSPLIQTDIFFFHGYSNPLPHSCRSGRWRGDHRVICGKPGALSSSWGARGATPAKMQQRQPPLYGAVFARV